MAPRGRPATTSIRAVDLPDWAGILSRRLQAASDIAVIGSGFAGSLIAMIARKLGRSVILLEKGRHPRFAIGESSTPLANLLLEELADTYDLPQLKPFTKYGPWVQTHPEIAVGLKRGFTFYHHQLGHGFIDDAERSNELLVAASPNDRIGDTHWYRPDFDSYLAQEAQRLGVMFIEEADLWGAEMSGRRAVLQGRHKGQPLEINTGFVIDASGPRGFLHRALELPEVPFKKMPQTQAIYSHFKGVKRWADARPDSSPLPYPPDDAAMHHIFDGGWIWVLRFNNGITSSGAALEAKLASQLRIQDGAPAWERLLAHLPSVRDQFSGAEATAPFVRAEHPSFLSGYIAGESWVLLPSAAGFVDPLLSTGFPLTLLGVQRLAGIIQQYWEQPQFCDELFNYSMQTTVELVTTERLIAALYASMRDFELFRALTLLYFPAASYTEAARRLRRPDVAGNTFLLGEHPIFGPRFRYCVDSALRQPIGPERALLLKRVQEAIDPINVAGLGDPARRHRYPALAADLIAGSNKLDVSEAAAREMIARFGFADS